jgi:HAD superfamily hydrolase (TIGR01484 family)
MTERSDDTRYILATDLDGTFAGGTAEARAHLQGTLAANPGAILLYVTGRSVPAFRELQGEVGLPAPDLLIADVGTTVVQGEAYEPVREIHDWIESRWPGHDEVRARLEGTPGIEEQDIVMERRLSFWLREGPLERAMVEMGERLQGLDVDLVGSADTYIDVLPAGVNKGSTLRRVIDWLGHQHHHVVVAGDTLNDLALLTAGYRGIAVGNAEPLLVERLRGEETVYFAQGHGAEGILEGLRHFGWPEERSGEGSDGE